MIEDIKKVLDEYKEDTERHFDVIAEDLKGDIKMLSEQVGANTETLETVKSQVGANTETLETVKSQVGANTETLETVKSQVGANTETLETIKLDIEFIKNDLKQKISRDEFAVLEKRVSLLEGKLHK